MGWVSGVGHDGERLADADIADLVGHVAGVLDELHDAGGVHGDLTPESIKVQRDSRGGIAAFWFRDDVGDTGGYRAPEVWSSGRSGAASDQYSLACVAFALLAGEPPFGIGSGEKELRVAHESAPVPTIARMRPELAALDAAFSKALSKSQFGRYADCEWFAQALREGIERPAPVVAERVVEASSGAPDRQPSPSPIPADPPESHRNRMLNYPGCPDRTSGRNRQRRQGCGRTAPSGHEPVRGASDGLGACGVSDSWCWRSWVCRG